MSPSLPLQRGRLCLLKPETMAFTTIGHRGEFDSSFDEPVADQLSLTALLSITRLYQRPLSLIVRSCVL
jgi:hypothetical protein